REVTEDTVTALLGAPQGDLQFELADAVAIGDAKEVFAVVQRVVEEGTDLRHFTGQALGHFRDLLLVRTAPEEPAVLDADADTRARLVAQGAKFTPGELSRILSLLVAAQTDMRWTTSPRLTLELALVRAALPEADPSSAGLGARIERLERLAGVEPAATPEVGGPPSPAQSSSADLAPEAGAASSAGQSPPNPRSADDAGHLEAAAPESEPEPEPEPAAEGPHAPDTSSLDIGVIRRSWPQLLERLQQVRKVVLRAHLESVTAAAFDGDVLELAFPPGRKFAVEKVQSKEEEFRDVFADVFGVRPRVRCVARDIAPGATVVDEEPPATKEDAVARLKAELDAAEVEELRS
ncbi:MAG TPA: hypothetical protein VKA30_03185, partial [Actinomycetota bacterium]|nr:hypothetical protein [Actinomycetota bacterium]